MMKSKLTDDEKRRTLTVLFSDEPSKDEVHAPSIHSGQVHRHIAGFGKIYFLPDYCRAVTEANSLCLEAR